MGILENMVKSNAHREIANCKREVESAEARGRAASIKLTARLRAARAAGDKAAEYAVWRDQGVMQASCQAKVDAAAKRVQVCSLQVGAYKSLASALA